MHILLRTHSIRSTLPASDPIVMYVPSLRSSYIFSSLVQKSTCSHLRAVRLQNLIKFKNADISGVVAVQCARHGFYMPQGLVDLMKGEA
jgi:hypothetical protein